jgi:hypothetical protein
MASGRRPNELNEKRVLITDRVCLTAVMRRCRTYERRSIGTLMIHGADDRQSRLNVNNSTEPVTT